MADHAEDILRTINIPNDASYDQLKQSLDRYFEVRRNLIIERAKFNRRVQQQGESGDVFIQDLYRIQKEDVFIQDLYRIHKEVEMVSKGERFVSSG